MDISPIERFQRNVSKDYYIIYEENQSCLNLVSNNKFSNRTKHIGTSFHFIRGVKDKKIVDYRYCPTDEMPANMLTKPLRKVKLKYMTGRCGLSN